MARTLDFWFDFASTYSFLSAKRIESLAVAAGVNVRWRPFLLGPIFQAQGWTSSPFNMYPAKGRYMEHDIRRIAATRGHDFAMPTPFPQRSISAARVALSVAAIADAERLARVCRAIFEAQFERGRSLEDRLMLIESIQTVGLDSDVVLAFADSDEIKARLRSETAAAQALGIFGAPTFALRDGELFWGDDRLRHALQRAAIV